MSNPARRLSLVLASAAAFVAVAAPAQAACRKPQLTKSYPFTSLKAYVPAEGWGVTVWSVQPTLRLVDNCGKGWIQIDSRLRQNVVAQRGGQIRVTAFYRSTKMKTWAPLGRIQTVGAPSFRLGVPGGRTVGPFLNGEVVTQIKVSTSLFIKQDGSGWTGVWTTNSVYRVPGLAKKRVAPKRPAPPPTSLPAAPQLPSPNA